MKSLVYIIIGIFLVGCNNDKKNIAVGDINSDSLFEETGVSDSIKTASGEDSKRVLVNYS
ncbi:MAG: hypothetical protein ACI85I_002812 [Arenicella sp.]|jgi:hypothetical protein